MIRTVRVHPQSYFWELEDMRNRVCQGVSTPAGYNGLTFMGMNNLMIRKVDFIEEAGIRLTMKNGISIEAVEMTVTYRA